MQIPILNLKETEDLKCEYKTISSDLSNPCLPVLFHFLPRQAAPATVLFLNWK